MKRKIFAVIIAVMAILGVTVMVGTSPASAANSTPGCITKTEWWNLTKGLNRQQVYNRVGTNGTNDWSMAYTDADGTGGRYVNYRQCNKYGKPGPAYKYITIGYTNYRYDSNWNLIRTPTWNIDWKGAWYY